MRCTVLVAFTVAFGCSGDDTTANPSSQSSAGPSSSNVSSTSGSGGGGMGGMGGMGGAGNSSSQGGTGAPGPECSNCAAILAEPACDPAVLDADSAPIFEALKQCACTAASCG